MTGFENIDLTLYKEMREKYLPDEIKYLFVAESPPAFNGPKPTAYFYFDNVPKADSLFYTLIKSIYDIDFVKGSHNRVGILNRLKEDGIYLIDAVKYPINKTRSGKDIKNKIREIIIRDNLKTFNEHLKSLGDRGHVTPTTNAILIKKTVYNTLKDNSNLNVINNNYIIFPRYIKDRIVISSIRNLYKE